MSTSEVLGTPVQGILLSKAAPLYLHNGWGQPLHLIYALRQTEMIEWRKIPNDRLLVTDVPDRGASWPDIVRFAASFNAYQHYEEPWAHSDWSHGIPIEEYLEDVRRRRQPNKAFEIAKSVRRRREAQGRWVGTLTELRACLFMHWRYCQWREEIPRDLTGFYDLLDAIRNMVAAGDVA